MQVNNVTAAKNKLKGNTIYIQKDYTEEEQNARYNLRQISKCISGKNSNVKVRLGEFCIFVNNNRYTWSSGKIIANSNSDAEYLRNLLTECSYTADVCVNGRQRNNAANAVINAPQ